MSICRATIRLMRRRGGAQHLASLLLGATLLVAPGAPRASAAEAPSTPTFTSLEADSATSVKIEYATNKEELVDGVRFMLYDTAGELLLHSFVTRPINGSFTPTGEYTFTKLQPRTEYCVGLKAWVGTGDADTSLFSEESERQCVTTPAPPQPRQNLAISEIRGKEEIDWAATNQRNPVYIFMLRNDGGDANERVVVEIQTSGVVTLANEQLPILVQGWESLGFTCERFNVSGGANAGLRCTGGTLKQGQEANPAVLTRVTGRGFGAVHVVTNVTRGQGDADPGDNSLTLNVHVS
jgi:hypothetical protein